MTLRPNANGTVWFGGWVALSAIDNETNSSAFAAGNNNNNTNNNDGIRNEQTHFKYLVLDLNSQF